MLIGAFSDTHENLPLIAKAVKRFNAEKVDLVLHAGDIISPFCADVLSGLHAPLVAVFGNNDGERRVWRERIRGIGEIHEGPFPFVRAGVRFLLMHAPESIDDVARTGAHDAIVYGHTHRPDVRVIGTTLIVNPGECGGWLHDRHTVALLRFPERAAEIVDLD